MVLNKTIGGRPSLKRLQKQNKLTKKLETKNVVNTNLTFTKIWGSMLIELRAGRYRALYGEASLVETGEVNGNQITVVAPKYSVGILNNLENKAILEQTIFNLFQIHYVLNIVEKPEVKDPNIDKLKKVFGKKLKIED